MRISWSSYVLALCVLFGGLGLTLTHFLKEISGIEALHERLIFPGPFELELREGKYVLFHEYAGAIGGVAYEVPPGVLGMRVGLKDPSGVSVPVKSPAAEQSYTIGTRKGSAVFAFEVVSAGRHTLEFEAEPSTAQPIVIALSGGGFEKMVGMVLRAIVLSAMAVIGGMVIAVLAFISDRKASSV